MRWLWLLALVACGRIDFDPLADAGPPAVSRCVPQAEVCNGIDDDCNDEIDEGCACMPLLQSEGTGRPDSVWFTGDGWVYVLATTPTDVDVIQLALDGTEKNRTNITLPVSATDLSTAWTGARLVIAGSATAGREFITIRPDGSDTQGPFVLASSPGGQTQIAARGSEIGAAYFDQTIVFQRFSSEGVPLGDASSVPTDSAIGGVAFVAARHDGWAVLWTDRHEGVTEYVHVALFDRDGQLVSSPLLGQYTGPGLVFSTVPGGYMLMFTTIDKITTIALDGTSTVQSIAGAPSMQVGFGAAWTGDAFRIEWSLLSQPLNVNTAVVSGGALTSMETLEANGNYLGGGVVSGSYGRAGIAFGFSATTTEQGYFAVRCP